jgi:hypothetical protein
VPAACWARAKAAFIDQVKVHKQDADSIQSVEVKVMDGLSRSMPRRTTATWLTCADMFLRKG